ncbi:rho guanine nucleotide exchange factor 11-like [Chamaea fasciata]|uniref:rho guanine nucleotide exchange factor 11-like n=1 Tax=Chamaea fasciata TaxID=190680 RepID=UPI00336A4F43
MRKLREEGPIIHHIGDLLLARFEGAAKEEFQRVAAAFCSGQSVALELIRTKRRKESRFQLFMQEAESNPQCRRLQLKDLIVSEMQRLTKYPLLLQSIIKCTQAGSAEQEKLLRARDHCRDIVGFVNDAVRRAENRQRLHEHQKRLDTTALERTSNPLAAQFRNLDLTSHRMIHEGPLAWRVGKDKSVELHVLLLDELLVLLQRQDERLLLKCHGKGAPAGAADGRQSFSPVLRLSSLLVRSVATGEREKWDGGDFLGENREFLGKFGAQLPARALRGHRLSPVLRLSSRLVRSVATDKRALFIICTSELGPQIYELVALTPSEKNTWMELLEQAVQGATRSLPGPPERRRGQAGPASGLELPEPAVSPELARATEPQECPPGADVSAPPARAPPLQEPPGDPDPVPGIPDSIPGIPKSPGTPEPVPGFPKSPGSAGVAEAALEDVETLRLLIIRRLRPRRDPNAEEEEEEDDVTPHGLGPGLEFPNFRPGIPHVHLGFPSVRPGFSRLQLGFGDFQPGIPKIRPGIPKIRPGIPKIQSGILRVQPGFRALQLGFGRVQSGFPDVQSRIPNVRPGILHVQPGFGDVQPGIPDFQSGILRIQPGFSDF